LFDVLTLLIFSPDVWNYAVGYLDSFFKIFDSNKNCSKDNNEAFAKETEIRYVIDLCLI